MRYAWLMRETITLQTKQREELIDITEAVRAFLKQCGMQNRIAHVYAQGATAAMMIQEDWDDSVPLNVVNLVGMFVSNSDRHRIRGTVILQRKSSFINPTALYDPDPSGYTHVGIAPAQGITASIAGQGGKDENGNLADDFVIQLKQTFANLRIT